MAGETNKSNMDQLLEGIDRQLLLKLLDSLIEEQGLNSARGAGSNIENG